MNTYTKPVALPPVSATASIQGGVDKDGGLLIDTPDTRTNNPAYEDE